MKLFFTAYATVACAFLALDAVWLSLMGPRLYKPFLQGLLADAVRPAPAVLFYVLYITGIVIFAVLPSEKPAMALLRGAAFGLVAYGTYDLTNQATLRVWPVMITLADLSWGAFATGVAASLASLACVWLVRG